MITSRPLRRLAATAAVAIATAGFAAPANASPADAQERCDAGLVALEAKFRDIEERRGWEEASEWWSKRWDSYYKRCLAP